MTSQRVIAYRRAGTLSAGHARPIVPLGPAVAHSELAGCRQSARRRCVLPSWRDDFAGSDPTGCRCRSPRHFLAPTALDLQSGLGVEPVDPFVIGRAPFLPQLQVDQAGLAPPVRQRDDAVAQLGIPVQRGG